MGFNQDRFVVIDGVQISKARATREGLIDDSGNIVDGPSSTRARTSASTRKGRGGKTADVAPAGDDGSADEGDQGA